MKYKADQQKQVGTLIRKLRGLGSRDIVLACDCKIQATASTYDLLCELTATLREYQSVVV